MKSHYSCSRAYLVRFGPALLAGLCLLLSALCPCIASDIAASTGGRHSGTVSDLASELGLDSVIAELGKIQQKPEKDTETRLKLLELRQRAGEIIRHVVLEVMEVTAAIDRDIAIADREHDYLLGRRQKGDRLSNFATFATTGTLLAVRSGLSFYPEYRDQINVLRSAQSAAAILIPSANMSRRFVEPSSSENPPNMLAALFERKTDQRSGYNKTVWNYLNSVPPDSTDGKTRRQELIASWTKRRGLAPAATAKFKTEIDLLTGTGRLSGPSSISLLDRKTSMLLDLRAEIGRLYRTIVELDRLVSQSKIDIGSAAP
ncbi:MAG: hypothetical protein Q8T09_22255 [Candidatus Melainabacteria bacterium]|nr:hypothetical protein [Candidatus Melainabacteria bacterium]